MSHTLRVGPVLIAASILVACGYNAIHISPQVADAKNYPRGVVAFTASGVTNPIWCIGTANGVCNGFIGSPATIDSSGHAQCIEGLSGTVTVLAGTGVKSGLPDMGQQLSTFGKAQLTCP